MVINTSHSSSSIISTTIYLCTNNFNIFNFIVSVDLVTMLEGKAVIGETDMLQTMQDEALQLAAKTLDFFDVTEATDIARVMKQV